LVCEEGPEVTTPRTYQLVPDSLSHDTVECLEVLLEQARKGEVVGFAFAAMLKRKGYIADTAGQAHQNPTFALGMISILADQVSHRIRGK
jgi:hypothetical protein